MIYLINLVADESINLNIIAGMIMKKEGDRLALADIRNRIDVDTCPHLQNFTEGKKETSILQKNLQVLINLVCNLAGNFYANYQMMMLATVTQHLPVNWQK